MKAMFVRPYPVIMLTNPLRVVGDVKSDGRRECRVLECARIFTVFLSHSYESTSRRIVQVVFRK